jgi:hypothetical protein
MKVGDRVVLESMDEDPNPVPVGTEGTIYHIGGGVVNVEWDNGRNIGLVVGFDKFRVIEQ